MCYRLMHVVVVVCYKEQVTSYFGSVSFYKWIPLCHVRHCPLSSVSRLFIEMRFGFVVLRWSRVAQSV